MKIENITPDALAKMSSQSPEIVPFDGPASRVTSSAIEFDGGLLVLRLFEIREPAHPRPQFVSGERQLVEVGRFAMSPVCLRNLDAAVQNAKSSYVAAMGHELPEPAKVSAALRKFALDAMAKAKKDTPGA